MDVDNFDEVLARTEPRSQLRLGGPDSPRLPIVFRSLDDFHPDAALYCGLEPFVPEEAAGRTRRNFQSVIPPWVTVTHA
jgi:hypothetical protein